MNSIVEPARAVRDLKRTPPGIGLPAGWWPVAFGAEVGAHPAGFRLGDRDLAVYRDRTGAVRAVDDACPHRRLPLSMGRLTEDGALQCAYHGWCFDGVTGQCTAIPNLGKDERVPKGIRVTAYTTVENFADVLGFGLRTRLKAPAVPPTGEEPDDGLALFDTRVAHGLVLVWTGADEPPAASLPAPPSTVADERTITGRLDVRAPHALVCQALLLNPGRVLGLAGLLGAGDEVCAAQVAAEGDLVTARRQRLASDPPRIGTYPSLARRVVATTASVHAVTGLARIEAASETGEPTARITVGLTPIDDYRTVVRWQAILERRPANAARAAFHATRRLVRSRPRPDAAEAVSDTVARSADPAVHQLRAARERAASASSSARSKESS